LVDEIYLVVKPYVTRAGKGPLNDEGSVSVVEAEVRPGVAIGDRRRVASFDWDLIQRATMVNRPTGLALTNVDRLWQGNSGVRSFGELTKEVRDFVAELEERTGTPVQIISTGPEIGDVVDRREE
jgi:adenylosuccinate synthase